MGFALVLATIHYGPRLRALGEKWEGTSSGAAAANHELAAKRDESEKPQVAVGGSEEGEEQASGRSDATLHNADGIVEAPKGKPIAEEGGK